MTLERLDYVTQGVERWPEKARKPKAMSFLSVYLESIQGNEDQIAELLDAFTNWWRPGLSLSFVLDIVGEHFLKQPRPADFDDENYRLLLIARTLVRVSSATLADVPRVVDYLARINGGTGVYNVSAGPPEHWYFDIFDVDLTAQWQVLYVSLLFDAIGAVASFTLNLNLGLF